MDRAESYTVGWIAVLSHELTAGLEMLDEEYPQPSDFQRNSSDSNKYCWGKMGPHFVVMASLPAGFMGKTPAAVTAAQMRASFPNLRVGFLVGIGAGIPFKINNDGEEAPRDGIDIRLGDVVISKPEGAFGGVVGYDHGKALEGSFQRIGHLAAPPRALLTALQTIRAQHERRRPAMCQFLLKFDENEVMEGRFSYPGPDKDPLAKKLEDGPTKDRSKRPRIHYGTIASGDTVVKSTRERTRILTLLSQYEIDPVCLETEAAGVMNDFPCLVVRGICDYADEFKDDVWQRYAAATAAAYTKEFLSYVDFAEIAATPRIGDVLEEGG